MGRENCDSAFQQNLENFEGSFNFANLRFCDRRIAEFREISESQNL